MVVAQLLQGHGMGRRGGHRHQNQQLKETLARLPLGWLLYQP